MRRLSIRTAAKINLCLRVLGRRADGYHEVETVLHSVGIWDRLQIDEAEPGMMERINPLGRAADADEIGNVIEYLALDAPPFLTGSTIFIDGGQTIRAAMP